MRLLLPWFLFHVSLIRKFNLAMSWRLFNIDHPYQHPTVFIFWGWQSNIVLQPVCFTSSNVLSMFLIFFNWQYYAFFNGGQLRITKVAVSSRTSFFVSLSSFFVPSFCLQSPLDQPPVFYSVFVDVHTPPPWWLHMIANYMTDKGILLQDHQNNLIRSWCTVLLQPWCPSMQRRWMHKSYQ